MSVYTRGLVKISHARSNSYMRYVCIRTRGTQENHEGFEPGRRKTDLMVIIVKDREFGIRSSNTHAQTWVECKGHVSLFPFKSNLVD